MAEYDAFQSNGSTTGRGSHTGMLKMQNAQGSAVHFFSKLQPSWGKGELFSLSKLSQMKTEINCEIYMDPLGIK